MIRVAASGAPADARARASGEVTIDVERPVTLGAVLDALEARYPMLRGTIRDQVTSSAGRSCASSPASGICRTSRRTPRSPMRS